MYVVGTNFANAYQQVLGRVYLKPEFVSAPRGQKIHEALNVVIEIFDPTSNLYKNNVRSSPISYIARELIWYISGDRTTNYIGKHASLWDRITNPEHTPAGGLVNSNYGNLAFYDWLRTGSTQYSWAYHNLVNDKDSRQAIMHYNNGSHQFDGVKDFVCTLNSIFHIRNNKLNMTTVMRSQDLILGLPADIVWFSLVHQQMFKHLNNIYPDLEMGMYTHIVNSLHVYEKHFELVENMLDNDFIQDATPKMRIEFFFADSLITASAAKLIDLTKQNIEEDFGDPLYNWINTNALVH